MMNHKLLLLLCLGLLALPLMIGARTTRADHQPAASTKPAAEILHHEVRPSQTDPKITAPDFPHEVYVNADGAGELLFLYLPGTGGRASNTQKLLLLAVAAGYHAVALDYRSNSSADQVCGNDPACYGPLRRAMLNGQHESPQLDVDADNCILNRARKLLAWLEAQYPHEHWGQFMTDGHINWDKVTVSGLSQGGGHAAMIAKMFKVHRVVMFSSVVDGVAGPHWQSASWLKGAHETPSDRYYGFAEANDHKYFPRIQVNWETLALPGALTSVETNAPPYHNSHRLFSALPGADPHAQVVRDALTPVGAPGQPVYEPVWRYLLGP